MTQDMKAGDYVSDYPGRITDDLTGVWSHEYVMQLDEDHYLVPGARPTPSETCEIACFVNDALWGPDNNAELVLLDQFRDTKVRSTATSRRVAAVITSPSITQQTEVFASYNSWPYWERKITPAQVGMIVTRAIEEQIRGSHNVPIVLIALEEATLLLANEDTIRHHAILHDVGTDDHPKGWCVLRVTSEGHDWKGSRAWGLTTRQHENVCSLMDDSWRGTICAWVYIEEWTGSSSTLPRAVQHYAQRIRASTSEKVEFAGLNHVVNIGGALTRTMEEAKAQVKRGAYAWTTNIRGLYEKYCMTDGGRVQ